MLSKMCSLLPKITELANDAVSCLGVEPRLIFFDSNKVDTDLRKPPFVQGPLISPATKIPNSSISDNPLKMPDPKLNMVEVNLIY